MKKIFVAVLIGCSLLCLVGCGKGKKSTETINSHIIESRNNIFAGSDDNFYATFCSGNRENPYSLDGVVSEMVPFGIVTFSKVDNSVLSEDEYLFTIVINGESVGGRIEKSPYDNTYSADIGKSVSDDAEISLSLDVNGKTFNQTLFNESKNFKVSQNDAIKLAGDELKDSISAMKDCDGKTCEAMVKILKDYSGESNRYFWYIGIISADGKTAGILVDVQTGEVVSKKV